MTDDARWFVGIDWASETHQVCLVDAGGKIVGERGFPHGGAGLAEMCIWLLVTTRAEPTVIAVAIEVPHGPIVETLLERGFLVYAINPKQLDRFRDRFTVAGAKDDRRDAHVLGDSLRTDRHCFRHLAAEDAVIVELREWSRMAEDLQQERNRLANRVREQAITLRRSRSATISAPIGSSNCGLRCRRRPRPPGFAKVVSTAFSKRTASGGSRRQRWLRSCASSRLPWPAAPSRPPVRTFAVAARLKLVNRQIKEAHRRLDALCGKLAAREETTASGQEPEPRDVTILRSLPGVGRIVLATLLAEAAEPVRRRDYHALRTLSGVAPVTKRSGKRCIVIMRQACHMRLRSAVYHWARVAIQHDPLSRCRYAELRKRGHSHGRALRSVADRLLAVACAMLDQQTMFDPGRAEKQAA